VRVIELEPETTVPVPASWRLDTRSALRAVLVAGLAS